MPLTDHHIAHAVRLAREAGATRVVLFGSAMEDPATARDLDLAVAGLEGWAFFELASTLERALPVPLDLKDLDGDSPAHRVIIKWGRTLYGA